MATTTKTRKKPHDPDSLGLIPEDQPAPPRANGAAPEDLGLEPVDEPTVSQDAPPVGQDWTPDRLGLLADEDQQPTAPPQEEDWWDWGTHQAELFVDTLLEAAGLEPTPPPANADMSTVQEPTRPRPTQAVPPGKMTAPGTVEDFLIPDFVEWPARSIYDWVNEPRTQRNLSAGGLSMVSMIDRQIANVAMLGRYSKDFVLETTGLPKNPAADQAWLDFEKDYRDSSQRAIQNAARFRIPDEERTVADALVEAIPQLPAMLAEYGAAGYFLGPAYGFAAVDALTHADEGWGGAGKAAVKGFLLGKFFEWASILGVEIRLPALAAAGAGTAYLEGGTDADIAAQAILFPLLSVPQRSGPIGVKYLGEHGIGPDLRDMGGHIRDLFVGGNVETAGKEAQITKNALDQVQAKHRLEQQTELARHVMASSKAKERAEGETEPDVAERVARERAEHDRNQLEILRRQQKEETPFRQAAETAERRYTRAQHPFRTSWQVAPYMRALHSAERAVLVVHNDGWKAIQTANEEADNRFKAAQAEAKKLREMEAKTPEERVRNLDMAEWLEQEGGRLAYDMRRQVEEEVEARILRAETIAMRRRQELAAVIGRGNKVEGRRASWLGADRDLNDAHRAGIRWIKIGEGRARRLVQMGDDYVARTDRQLRDLGITPEKSETKAEYETHMARAQETRESYRDLAARELLDAQYKADSRVSLASHRRDQATRISAEAATGKPRERRNAAKKDRPTKPEDAKKEDEPDWDPAPEEDPLSAGPEFQLAYRRAIEATRDDPGLAELVKRVDPILQNINDPTDVLPAIARIAKELGYKPGSTRGVQNAGKREQLAKALGMTEKEFLDSPYGKAFSDYEIEAALMLMDRAWKRVQDAYVDYKRNPGSEIARQRVIMELTRFMMIRNRLRGAASEAGRSLRMFREVKERYGGITEKDGFTDSELDMIMTHDKPGKAGRLAEKIMRGDWFSALIDYYIQGLLSSLQTAWVNIVSGLSMLIYKPLQTVVGATIGIGRWAFGGVLRMLWSPFRAVYRAMARTGVFGREARENAEVRSEDSALYPFRQSQSLSNERVRFGEVGARFRGYIEAFIPAVIQFFRTWWTGEKYLGETNFRADRFGRVIGRILPGRLLGAIDDFFKVLMYRSGQRAHAYRQAVAEHWNMAIDSPAAWVKYKASVRKRYQELVKHPTQQINAMAKREALEGTFQNEPEIFKGSGKLIEGSPGLKFLVPFRKVLLNTVEFFLRGSPFFFLVKKTRMDLWGANGRYAQDMALAHILIVTGGATIIYYWALGGNVRESSRDPKARAINQISGVPPLAVRIPGTNDWVTLNRVDPIGGIVALGAYAAKASKAAAATGDEDSQWKAIGVLITSMFGMTLDRAGFRGLADFMEAFQGGQYGQDYNSYAKFIEKLVATLAVPQLVAVDARTHDPYLRYARTQMEEIMQRTRLRAQLWPVRNMWGDPIRAYDSYNSGNEDVDYWMNMNSPFYWGKLSKDPATAALMKIYEIYNWAPGQVQRNIGGRRLTDEEFDFYAQKAGNYQYAAMKRIAASPEWGEAEAIDKRIKGITKTLRRNDGLTADQYTALTKEREALREDLRKKRFNLYNRVKKDFSAARRKARLETAGTSDGKVKGRFPEIWKRQRRRDASRVPGETPDFLEGFFQYMEGENDQETWDGEQADAHNDEEPTFDPTDPYGDLRRMREGERRTNPAAP